MVTLLVGKRWRPVRMSTARRRSFSTPRRPQRIREPSALIFKGYVVVEEFIAQLARW